MLGEKPEKVEIDPFELEYVGVKCSQFSFSRLGNADPVLGVDMSSTGEVGCIGDNLDDALLKAMLSVGHRIPKRSVLISSGNTRQKADMLLSCELLRDKGIEIYATEGTCRYLNENGVPAHRALWPGEELEEGAQYAMDLISANKVDLVINIPKNYTRKELSNGYRLRRSAIDFNIPLITNSRLATAYIRAFCKMTQDEITIRSWDEYKA